MAEKSFHDMGGTNVTQGEIRDWLMDKVADMLKCPREDIGVEENFASLGLDSLSLFTLTGDLAAWLGYDLSATLLLRYTSIDDLAEHLAKTERDEFTEPPPRPADGRPLPVTLAQERVLKYARLPPERDANLIDGRFVVRGNFDPEALRSALTEMVGRHESLRSTFGFEEERFVQFVHPPQSAFVEEVDWSEDEVVHSEEKMMDRACLIARQPMDLSSLPLFRTLIIKVGPEDYRLMFVLHHLLCDAEGFRVFYEEVGRGYAAFKNGFIPAWEPLEWQLADFAIWERNWLRLDGAAYQERLAWWREYWRTPPRRPGFAFAWKTPPVAPPVSSSCFVTVSIDEDTRIRTDALARECQATWYTVLFSAFACHLLKHTSEQELIIGTYVSDRKRVAARQLLGMFTSMVPIRVTTPQNMTFREQVRQSQENLDSVSLHRELPFEHLVERLKAEESPVPEVHTMFQQVKSLKGALQLDGLQTSAWRSRAPRKMVPGLNFTILKAPDGLKARVAFDGTQYEPAAVQAFLTSFVESLHRLVSDPDESLDFRPAAPAEEDWQHLFGPG